MKLGYGEYNLEFSFAELKEAFTLIAHLPQKFKIKNKEKKINIVFAIVTESEAETNRLNHDLINPFCRYLDAKGLSPLFEVKTLLSSEATKIKDFKDSKDFLEKTKNHLIIYGSICKRQNMESNYVLNLDATILHNPIPVLISSNISRDFSEVFPRRVLFPENVELLGFNITKEWLGIAIRYMVGVAALVSGNLGLAYSLFKGLNKELISVEDEDPIREQFRRKSLFRIIESAKLICDLLYNVYTKTGDLKPIKTAKEYIDVIKANLPNDDLAITLGSIYYYLIENNLDKCEELLTRDVQHSTEPTWRLNLAFIKTLKGELLEAKKLYDKASKNEFETANILNEAEIFISKEIITHPNKPELFFSRGYINFKLKGDYLLSKEDFEIFLQKVDKKKYEEMIRLVKVYLEQINKLLENTGEIRI